MTNRAMSLLFTSNSGEVFEIDPEELPPTCSLSPKYTGRPSTLEEMDQLGASAQDGFDRLTNMQNNLDGASPVGASAPRPCVSREGSCEISSPLIALIDSQDASPITATQTTPSLPFRSAPAVSSPTKRRLPRCQMTDRSSVDTAQAWMVYNEYGELVEAQSVLNPPASKDLTVTQILRLIQKAYRHDVSPSFFGSASLHNVGFYPGQACMELCLYPSSSAMCLIKPCHASILPSSMPSHKKMENGLHTSSSNIEWGRLSLHNWTTSLPLFLMMIPQTVMSVYFPGSSKERILHPSKFLLQMSQKVLRSITGHRESLKLAAVMEIGALRSRNSSLSGSLKALMIVTIGFAYTRISNSGTLRKLPSQ